MQETAYFLDFKFYTEKSTFFPRPETEILVEKALLSLSKKNGLEHSYSILDIGTGCGNIAISLTKYLPSSRIIASDISEKAIWVASKNARENGVFDRINLIKSNIFQEFEGGYRAYFDLVISNPPYISLEDIKTLPGEVKNDPYSALYGGKDGLLFYRHIIREAPYFLKEKGLLMMEVGYNQAEDVRKILEDSGFSDIDIYKDYASIKRIVKAELWKSS